MEELEVVIAELQSGTAAPCPEVDDEGMSTGKAARS
jgi:hypothetical protein